MKFIIFNDCPELMSLKNNSKEGRSNKINKVQIRGWNYIALYAKCYYPVLFDFEMERSQTLF